MAIYALKQTEGIGSRDNVWHSAEGNLHLSFCIQMQDLPSDLPLASVSIYFAYLLKEVLEKNGSKAWVKWPNDIYLDKLKIGGVMSTKLGDFIVCSVGLNLKTAPKNSAILDIKIDLVSLVEEYIKEIEKKVLWKFIFRKYMLEFEKSKAYKVHCNGEYISLEHAFLYEDGSILLNDKRVYSLR